MFRLYRVILSSSALFLLFGYAAAQNNCNLGTFFTGSSCKPCPKGTYGDQRKATSCKPCPKGSFSPIDGLQGLDACRQCPSGTFGTAARATSLKACKPCPKGTSSVPGALTCISCKPGSFISSSVKHPADRNSRISKCFPCGFESFSDKPNSLTCKVCKPGSTNNKAHTACQKCPRGSAPTDTGLSCERCYAGTFGVGTRPCERCPNGFQPNRRRGADKCVPCPPGTASESFERPYCRPCKNGGNKNIIGGTLCIPPNTPCPANYFFNSRGACHTCKKGERYNAARKTCVSCGDKAQSKGGISEKCTRCPANEIGSPNGCICGHGRERLPNGSCRLCPAGTFQTFFSDFQGNYRTRDPYAVCEDCAGGSFSLPGSTKCTVCPTGKVVKKDRSGCEKCPKGTLFRPQVGDDENGLPLGPICVDPRTNCAPGEERVVRLDNEFTGTDDELGDTRCQVKSCPSDTIEEFGEFSINGFVYQRVRTCVSCPPGSSYRKGSGCTTCPGGKSNGGISKCKKCPKGLFQSANGRECKCANSVFEVTRGVVNGKCRECPKGTKGILTYLRDDYADLGLDFSGCFPCPAGFLQAESGQDLCQRCRAGTFSSKPGAARCTKCPAGSISFGIGDTSCVVVGSLKKGGKKFVTG